MVKIVLGRKKPEQSTASAPAGNNIFGAAAPATDSYDMKEDLSSVNRRVKVLEERYTNLRSRSQVTEQNMLHKNKTFFTEIKTINLELTEIKKEINELKDKILSIIKELESFAKKENVDILRKYIDLWNPVNFVTKKDVEAIVKEIIDKKE